MWRTTSLSLDEWSRSNMLFQYAPLMDNDTLLAITLWTSASSPVANPSHIVWRWKNMGKILFINMWGEPSGRGF